MGCYLTCPPECQGPRLTFGGRVLFSIHTQSKGEGGPRPHCLSNNWDVKPFTVSSGEASKLKNLKNRKQKKEERRARRGLKSKKFNEVHEGQRG